MHTKTSKPFTISSLDEVISPLTFSRLIDLKEVRRYAVLTIPVNPTERKNTYYKLYIYNKSPAPS